MPQRITIPFVGGTAKARSIQVNNQETVNLITAVKGTGAKAPVVLESAPGLVDQGSIGNGPLLSSKMVNWKGDLYGVFGTELVQISETTGATVIGTLNGNPGRVRIARGRNAIALVDGTDGYSYDGSSFDEISDADFPAKPTHIVYLDGFFIVNDADTDNFYISGVEDPTDWNALDFEAASAAPDNALGLAATESVLYILGDETTQAYYNTGNADFPYEVILSATQEVGVRAPDSIAESDAGVFMLGTTPEGGLFVYAIAGQAGQIISGEEQEHQLSEVTDPGSAYGFIYTQAGKSFYVLQLDGGAQTLVYNIRAQVWETRESQDGTGWRAAGHGVLGTRNLVGSRLAARYYELDLTTYTDAGEELIRRRRTQVYHHHDHSMDWHELVIDVAAGVGNVADPGVDPVIRLRYSNDGGHTWSDQLVASIGKIGEYGRRAVFRNLGIARNRIFEIEASDPVPITIVGAYAAVSVLND